MATGKVEDTVARHSHSRPVRQAGRFLTRQELLRFPHKLIRDIAFVVFCPPLLLSSDQLPVVDPHVFASNSSLLMPTTLPNSTSTDHHAQYTNPRGCNNNQSSSVNPCDSDEMDGHDAMLAWLESLDEGHVAAWFREKKQSARLGDHYALCILFVLTFGPNLKPRDLRTSVQVHVSEARGKPTRLIFPEPGTETDKSLSEPLPESESSMLNMTPSGLLKPGPDHAKLPSLEGLGVPNLELAPARPELEFPELRQMGRRARKRFLRESRDRKGRIQTVGEFDVLFTLPPHSPPPQSLSPPSPPPVSPPPHSPDHSHSPALSLKRVGVYGVKSAADGAGDADTAGVATVDGSATATAAAVAAVQSPAADADVPSSAAVAASGGGDAGDAAGAAAAPVLHHWELSVKFLLFVGSWDDALSIFSRGFPPSESDCSSSCSNSSSSRSSSNSNGCSSSDSSSTNDNSSIKEASPDPEWMLGQYLGPHVGESLRKAGIPPEVIPPELVPPEESPDPEWLLGQYLGPHVGESLRDRKARLSRQLQLGRQGHGAQLITRMYGAVEGGGPTDTGLGSFQKEKADGEYGRDSCGILQNGKCRSGGREMSRKENTESCAGGGNEACGEEESGGSLSSLQAAALLQGYLFYEYPLWLKMREMETGQRGRSSKGETALTTAETTAAEKAKEPANAAAEAAAEAARAAAEAAEAAATAAGTAAAPCTGVFPWHWHGWWTHDAAAVVHHPRHVHSRWYILPKAEWLSPVIVPVPDRISPTWPQHPVTTSPGPRLDDISPGAVPDPGATCQDAELGAGFAARPDGIATPLTGVVLLETIHRCSEDARSRKLPRKLRFLVAELRWDPEYLTSKNIRVIDSSIDNACDGFGNGEESGAWVEVSRGFIVEEGWPDSRSHPPHGFVWREGRGTPFW